jgi:outer membrane protein assembly factor BamA
MHYLKYSVLLVLFNIPLLSPLWAQTADSTLNTRSKTFVAMPLVNSNPAMKTGFGGIGMYLFPVNKDDEVSPPSVVGLTGLYSTNKSYVFALPAMFYLAEDTYRIMGAAAVIRVNNDFTYETDVGDVGVVYSELRTVFGLEFSRKIANRTYLGLLYSGGDTRYRFDQGSDLGNELARLLFRALGIGDNFSSSLGLKAAFDSRDYPYYPTKGLYAVLRPMYNARWLGSENDYTTISYDLEHFHSFKPRHLLATKLAGGHSVGDVPFSGYQTWGMRGTLRGYPTGKYRGLNLIGIQTEYRWQFYKRWGMVAFGGVGTIWGGESPREEEIFEKQWLPSVGTGLRFLLSEEKHINMRLDAAWGVNGEKGIYFGIMEAF